MIINDCKSNTRGIVLHMWAYFPSTHLQMYCWMYYSMKWKMSLSIMQGIAYGLGTGVEHVIQSENWREARYTVWELEGSTWCRDTAWELEESTRCRDTVWELEGIARDTVWELEGCTWFSTRCRDTVWELEGIAHDTVWELEGSTWYR